MSLSYKLETMVAILHKLANHEQITAGGLADDFRVSRRSAERYVEVLRNAGFPILYDRALRSYVFDEGYSLTQLDFTAEESLVFGLAKDLIQKDFGPEMAELLAGIEKRFGLCSPGLPKYIRLSQNAQSPEVERYFQELTIAIPNLQRIEIVYDALHNQEKTCRKVDPYYLFFNEGIWLLRGYCHLRKSMRTFALDKIRSLKLLNDYFMPKVDVFADDDQVGTFGSFTDGEPVTVVVRFMKEFAPYLRRKKWHASQTVKELKNSDIEVTFRVNGLIGIKYWLYRWIPYMEIIEPKELKDEVVEDLKKELKRMGTRVNAT